MNNLNQRSQSLSRQAKPTQSNAVANRNNNREVVPRGMMNPIPMRQENGMLVPEGEKIDLDILI